MRRIGLFLIFSLLVGISFGQIDVTNDLTIEEYVTDILLGSGVQASNITFTGWENQIGLLNGGDGTIFPMDAGLVLSSANAQNLDGSIDENVPFGEGTTGDPDLLDIANSVPPLIGQNFVVGSVNDVCILEFDFIATGDTVKFNYSFGSDEYLGWVNSQYNDIFAFLLSGDGIVGPYDSPAAFPNGAVNIAQVPDTDPPLPITISSVNDVTNSEYYINNPNNTDIMINGFTTKLQAVYEVECGGSYHMKLAIADGSDTILESIVVLEQGSFESNAVVQVSLETDVGVFYDEAIIYEDCGEAVLTIARPIETILEVEETVLMSYGGTAENGVDFTELPEEVVFPPFVEVLEFPMDAFLDGLPEGEEEVTIEFLNLAACGGSGLTSYFTFIVDDSPDPLEVNGYNMDICLGDEITLTPEISGGYGNFDFDWTPLTDDTYEIDVAPDVNTTYFLTVSDTCGVLPVSTTFDINVADFPELTVEVDPSEVALGCFDGLNLIANASGGDGNYVEYSWVDDDGGNLWGWFNTLWVSAWNGSNGVNVTVTDGCGFTATDAVDVTFTFPELIIEQEPLEVTCGTEFTIDPTVSGGEGFYNYNWYVNGLWVDWQSTYTTSTEEDMEITVEVFDDCGQTTSLTIPITVSSPDIELTLVEEVVGSCIEVFNIEPIVGAGSGGFNYSWTLNGTEIGTGPTLDFQSDIDVVVQLLVWDNCDAQAVDQVLVTIENPPLDMDLGADIDASCIDNTDIDALIYSGSGGYTYSWQIDGQEVGTGSSLTWQTYETEQVTLEVSDACGGYDMDQIQINIPDIPLEISLSPDTSICEGGTAFVGALAEGGEGGFVYYWTSVNTYGQDIIVSPSNTQVFNVTATDICGESITDQVQVVVQNVFADFAVTYITEEEVQFTATIDPPCPDCELIWDFGDGTTSNEQNPLHEFDGLGSYDVNLTIVTDIGCFDDSYTLIHSPALLYIPTAFTPNNDGVNDVWQVIGDEILFYEMVVFDRWGETVFYSTDHTEPWLGDALNGGTHYVPNGTYSYVVKVKSYNSDAFEKTGIVTLMR
jgi:gliding motility-associated-like protein